jgi:hypothetical protein
MDERKLCGEPCAACDGCIEAHEHDLRLQVASAEALVASVQALLRGHQATAAAAEERVAALEEALAEIVARDIGDAAHQIASRALAAPGEAEREGA